MSEGEAKRQRLSGEKDKDKGEVVLYTYWRSSCSWRVRIALAIKETEYESRPIHLVKDGGQQLKPEYANINPNQVVPTLVDGDVVLSQSGAIIEYLEETRPQPALLPNTPQARARVRSLCNLVGCDIQPVQNLRVLRHVMSKFESQEDKTKEKLGWGKHFIASGFRALEKELSRTAGMYCMGDDLTMADLYIPPQVYNAGRFGVDMSEFPIIVRIEATLAKLPAFQAAHPDAQPDAQ